MAIAVDYKRLALVPGTSGTWEGKPTSAFRTTLQRRLESELHARSLSLPHGYQSMECAARQGALERAMRSMLHRKQVWVGHSEGGARILHALRDPSIASRLQAVVLVSPAYALWCSGSVDVDAALETLRLHSVRVLLLDTETGFGGQEQRYAWPSTRGKLTAAIFSNPLWQQKTVVGAHHSLRRGYADTAVEAVTTWARALAVQDTRT